MKTTKYYKQMKAVMIFTVIMSLFWLYWTIGRTFNTISDDGVPLRDGYEVWQIGFVASYSIFAIALMVVQFIFLIKQMKSIKNGMLFDKSSAKYLILWGVLWLFYDFCSGNVGQMIINGAFNEIVIHGTTIGFPVIAITFAILYKMAANVAEENNLTI